jgi:hypothetical protein
MHLMKRTIQTSRVSGLRRAVRAPLALAVVGALALTAQSASAIEFGEGDFSGSFNTTLSYGASMRVQERDDNLIAKSHFNPALVAQIAALTAAGDYLGAQQLQLQARGRFSANRDDGNLKYDDGDLISNAAKITSELALNWRDSGAFARATYFYDFENAGRDDLSETAQDLIGERFRLLDAFVFHNFSYGEAGQGSVRLGRQVVSWGESTFIQNGINVINPIDISALRVAGAELKEAFLPIDIALGVSASPRTSRWKRSTCSSSRKSNPTRRHLFQHQRFRVASAATT